MLIKVNTDGDILEQSDNGQSCDDDMLSFNKLSVSQEFHEALDVNTIMTTVRTHLGADSSNQNMGTKESEVTLDNRMTTIIQNKLSLDDIAVGDLKILAPVNENNLSGRPSWKGGSGRGSWNVPTNITTNDVSDQNIDPNQNRDKENFDRYNFGFVLPKTNSGHKKSITPTQKSKKSPLLFTRVSPPKKKKIPRSKTPCKNSENKPVKFGEFSSKKIPGKKAKKSAGKVKKTSKGHDINTDFDYSRAINVLPVSPRNKTGYSHFHETGCNDGNCFGRCHGYATYDHTSGDILDSSELRNTYFQDADYVRHLQGESRESTFRESLIENQRNSKENSQSRCDSRQKDSVKKRLSSKKNKLKKFVGCQESYLAKALDSSAQGGLNFTQVSGYEMMLGMPNNNSIPIDELTDEEFWSKYSSPKGSSNTNIFQKTSTTAAAGQKISDQSQPKKNPNDSMATRLPFSHQQNLNSTIPDANSSQPRKIPTNNHDNSLINQSYDDACPLENLSPRNFRNDSINISKIIAAKKQAISINTTTINQ
jgi:hypothetical protein